MAQRFLVNLDLNKNELQNARIQNLATAPSAPVSGQVYYDTVASVSYEYNGTSWIARDAAKVANGSIPIAKLAIDPLARANHTGIQSVSTLTGILPPANGGTGIAFFTAAGPTATRIYTFPDAAATIARTDAGQTFTGVQTMTSPALTTPVITGLPTGTGVSSANAASTLVSRDSSGNFSAGTITASLTGNISGNAATVTTNANLTGDVTSVGNATTLGNAPVIAKVLTAYTKGPGTVTSADSILSAIQKLDGNDELKATIISPTFSGVPTAPTASPGTSTTQIATTAFVAAADALKANLASPTFTGTVTVPTPVNDTDAATKGYADSIKQSLDIKDSVRVATTSALPANTFSANTLTASSVGVLTVDGVSLVKDDRILVKNEAAPANNGIYILTTAGTAGVAFVLTRVADANTSAEVTSGMYTFVSEGTVNGSSGFVLATVDPISLNTTALTFTQFSGAGQITAGAGLVKNGNTLDVVGTTNRILVNANDIDIGTDVVTLTGSQTLSNKTLVAPILGTPASGVATNLTGTATGLTSGVTNALKTASASVDVSAATAPTTGQVLTATSGTTATWQSLTFGTVNKYAVTIGNNSSTSIAVTHNLGNSDVIVSVRQVSDNAVVECDVVITSNTVATLNFAVAPATNALRVTVIG